MTRVGSFPYMIVIGAVTVLVCSFLFLVFDAGMEVFMSTEMWNSGGERATEGRETYADLWSLGMLFVVTGTGMSVLLAARRRS